MLNKIKTNFNWQLTLILFFAFLLRFYGLNWDSGFHLHPDERMLIMVADRIHFFNQLNPEFFNYGSLPVYLLKGVAQLSDFIFLTSYNNYQGMLLLGRSLSMVADFLTIYIIYQIGLLIFNKKTVALFSSFFYAVAFFPIQNSHFFISDVFLTAFTTLLLCLLLHYLNHDRDVDNSYRGMKLNVLMGIIFAAMLATKFTAVVFLPLIWLIFIMTMKKWKNLVIDLLSFNFSLLTFNFLFMPYAFIENKRFISDILAQVKMNSDPYIFPYTLQYVGTIPYWYYIKNIFLWGLGPIISILSMIGFIHSLLNLKFKVQSSKLQLKIKKLLNQIKNNQYLIVFLFFYLFYFLIIGRSAVKFMRYMLLLYPMFAILAAYGFYKIYKVLSHSKLARLPTRQVSGIILLSSLIWSLMFVNIYSQEHSRITATKWILNNIPAGSYVATEHWDDGLPLTGGEKYNHIELPLYEQPDDDNKWNNIINPRLQQAEYIIIASNRLYVPLQKLSDCNKFKLCYPKTAEYYQKLFNGQLAFKKVAEFAIYPQLSINNYHLTINDQSADESFTVYDHPKIMIFKRIKTLL